MSKTSFSLLAAALLGVVTAPVAAAPRRPRRPPPEATAAAYVFTDGTTTESLTAENADLTAPLLASGYTAAHPGWDLRLSDEAYAPATVPVQDYRVRASHTATGASAGTGGYISLVDGGSVPFAVVRHSRSASCPLDGPLFTGGGGGHGVWVRRTSVKVNRYSAVGQLSGYSAFAKYEGRAKAGTLGWEVEITQGAQTYRVLVGAVAASC